jgi:hypothetical protein
LGLDNYPSPDPCEVLEQAGKLKIYRDKWGIVDCVATNCPLMIAFSFPTLSCWIRGKVFNRYVEESCGESLYEDKTRGELEYILDSLKKYYKNNNSVDEEVINQQEHSHVNQLIKYLETLLTIKEWNGKLIASF